MTDEFIGTRAFRLWMRPYTAGEDMYNIVVPEGLTPEEEHDRSQPAEP
jgi:hypothetical protein